ncbi:MAG: septum formation inhibitor Maf [Legionellales bacterium]|nr:septum formation inhibitor Maf [Legionellales bacterium]
MVNLCLASQSDRRKKLLEQIGLSFTSISPNIDETPFVKEEPDKLAIRLSKEKASFILHKFQISNPVIGADTVVVFDQKNIGKPHSIDEAINMLKMLSGNVHEVYTGVTVMDKTQVKSAISVSKVHLSNITEKEILNYLKISNPLDKAGSYDIQGLGAVFIKHLEGSYSGVMGLPIYETSALLRDFSVNIL